MSQNLELTDIDSRLTVDIIVGVGVFIIIAVLLLLYTGKWKHNAAADDDDAAAPMAVYGQVNNAAFNAGGAAGEDQPQGFQHEVDSPYGAAPPHAEQ
jgi:hypothetical protein